MEVPVTYFLVIPTVKILGEIVRKIILTWISLNIKVSLPDLICYPENLISMDRDICFFTVYFAMPTAVRLSQCIVIRGCVCLNSSRMVRIILPYFVFRNKAPSYGSADEATTNLRIPLWTYIAPLSGIGLCLLGTDQGKNALLCNFWLVPPIGMLHWSECLISFMMHSIVFLHMDVW